MGWESTPWAVTNGLASAELARLSNYVGTQGSEGITGADDLKVTQRASIGAGIRVGVGAALIPCRASGQQYQSYTGRMPTEDTSTTTNVAVTTTTARNDLVIARVEDPWLAGEPWADPPVGQESTGPYIFTRVISNVGAAALSRKAARDYIISQGWSAIPLAGLVLPANTAAVQDSMIVDLRSVAQPKTEHRSYPLNPGVFDALTSATIADWFGSWQVDVPFWATRAVVSMNIGGISVPRLSASASGIAQGQVRAILGTLATQSAGYDFECGPSNIAARFGALAGDTLVIPSSMRNTTQTLRVQGSRTGSSNVNAAVDASSFVIIDIDFQQVAG